MIHTGCRKRSRLLRRAELQIDELVERVRPIVQAIHERRDEALLDFTARFDRVQLTPNQLRVSRAEIDEAHQLLDPQIRAALNKLFTMYAHFTNGRCHMSNGLLRLLQV